MVEAFTGLRRQVGVLVARKRSPETKKPSNEDNNNISATNITKNSWRFSQAKHLTVEFAEEVNLAIKKELRPP